MLIELKSRRRRQWWHVVTSFLWNFGRDCFMQPV